MIALKQVLVVVADAAEAKFFIAHGPKMIKQIDYLQHAQSRLLNQELTTKETDFITCPYEDKNSMKNHEKIVFAKKVARNMEKIIGANNLNEICIMANPNFLGELHKNFNHNNINVIAINKDLLKASDQDVLHDALDAGVTFMDI